MMISEPAQEQATLYALGLLDADEAADFERELDADDALRALVKELRESAATMAEAAVGAPPAALKVRVLERVTAEARRAAPGPTPFTNHPAKGKVVTGPWGTWVPWALAASFMICCGFLGTSSLRLQHKVSEQERSAAETTAVVTPLGTPAPPDLDALRRVVFCPLEPTAAGMAQPRAAVLWDATRREGRLRLTNLPAPDAGHDYQLWVVESGHKETISAGVVPVANGKIAEIPFRPVPQGGTDPVVAFALSLERAGGSPTNQGPVLFLGKL